MSKVVVVEILTLDGVMQAPGGPTRTGAAASRTAAGRRRTAMRSWPRRWRRAWTSRGSLLFGRTHLRGLRGFWPHQTDNPFTAVLNEKLKYVASTTLAEPLPWRTRRCSRATRPRRWPRLKRRARQRHRRARQRRAGPGADAARPRRRVRAARSTRWCWDPGGGCSPTTARSRGSGSSTRATTTTGVVIATYQPTARRRTSDEAVPAQHLPARRRAAAAGGPGAGHAGRRRAEPRS